MTKKARSRLDSSLARIGKARDLRPAPLLYDRAQTSALLGGVSVATLLRLEAAGRLQGIKLFPNSPTGKVFYPANQVRKLAGGDVPREDDADD